MYSWRAIEEIRNNPDIGKPARIVIYAFMAFPTTFLLGILIWSTFFAPSAEETFLKEKYSLYFQARIDTLYIDERNHGVKTAILSGGYKLQISPSWESQIEVGDSLSKISGSFNLEIYKSSGKKITLSYKDEVKNWK